MPRRGPRDGMLALHQGLANGEMKKAACSASSILRRTPQIGGPAHRRPACAVADQAMVASAGRGVAETKDWEKFAPRQPIAEFQRAKRNIKERRKRARHEMLQKHVKATKGGHAILSQKLQEIFVDINSALRKIDSRECRASPPGAAPCDRARPRFRCGRPSGRRSCIVRAAGSRGRLWGCRSRSS
jgi:hypothetical protein